MTNIEERSRRAADRHLDSIRERFGDIAVREVTVENDPESFEHARRMARGGRLASAGAWVLDHRRRLLLVRAEGAEEWGPPGGTHEPDESILDTARREVAEESGVAIDLLGVAEVRRKVIVHREDPDRRLHMVDAWFEARPADPGIDPDPDRIDRGETIADVGWFERPPDSLGDQFADRARSYLD